MRVPNLVPIGPQAATCIRPEGYTHRQTDRQTDTHTLSYIDLLAGYPASLETLSPGLSPPPSLVPLSPLSYSSLPSTLPPSLGLPGFAQDNCIPEILFKPWSLVTLKFSPLTPPPPSDGVGWGLHVLVIFSAEFFLFIDFLGSSWNFPHFWNFDPPIPPPGTLDPPGWGG